MADVVLGVAYSLVQGTIAKAQSAIEESSNLQQSAQRDLEFIVGEFVMMQSLLSTTTNERNVRNNVVGTWVAQVLDLAYDVEDNIELVVQLITMSESDHWYRMIPSFLRKSLPLDQAVGIIAQLKVKVQDVMRRKERYIVVGDSGVPKPVMEMKQLATTGSSFDMLNEAGSSAMKQQDIDALTKLVTMGGSDLEVISVLALDGDIGAASRSIIRKAYDNTKIWQDFECRVWVKLGNTSNPQRPLSRDGWSKWFCKLFSTASVHLYSSNVRSLMDQFRGAGPVIEENIFCEFKEQVDNQRYLVVLEDLSTKDDWDDIVAKLPNNGKRSRIVILTEQFQFASSYTGLPYIHHFWADNSVCVFCKEVPANNVLIGRTSDINQLPGYLAKARLNTLQVMSVWGIPGAGKSALVRNVYNDMMRPHNNQFQKHGWVNVSQPFNLRSFSWSILVQFRSHSLEENEARDPVEECRNLLRDHRCLVVVDDLHLIQDWEMIQAALISRPSQSLFIVITSDEKIAFHCADRKDLVFNVKVLGVKASLDLFKEKAQNSNNIPVEYIDKDLVLQQLISKCGGLPKVMVALADTLGRVFNWIEKARILNTDFVVNLEKMPEFVYLHGLFSWMHSYLGALPMHFRKLVAYLLIFPAHSSIRRRRLVMRWGAEGYSTDNESNTADENGEALFSWLVNQAMIQPPTPETITNMRMVSFEFNAFFREYMISRPLEENIATAIELFVLKGSCSPTSRRRGRHLVIEQSWARDTIVFGKIDFSRLRSLTVFGKWESFFISDSMKVLRVLDLENASGVINKDLKNILKMLRRLKFLSLRGCSEINYLPSSVGELRELQILDIRYTSMTTIPVSITNLRKLQYIRAGPVATPPPEDPSERRSIALKFSALRRCLQFVGVEVMIGIGRLTDLHTLGVINVESAVGKGILKELKNLTQLHKLGVSGINRKNGREFCSAVSCHSRLESLSVWLSRDNQDCLDGMVPENTNKLQSLKLYGPLEKFPMSIRRFCNLRKLNLEVDILSGDDIGVLGDIQELCILRLRVNTPQDMLNFWIMTAGVEERCYKKIQILEIASRYMLHLSIGNEAMENLEILKAGCYSTGSVPQFGSLNHLKKLKEVQVIGYINDEQERHLKTHFAGHPCKPTLTLRKVNLSAQVSIAGNAERCSFPFSPVSTSRLAI